MTQPIRPRFQDLDLDAIKDFTGAVAVFIPESGKLDTAARRVNKLTRGVLARFAESDAFDAMSLGGVRKLSYPSGMEASEILVAKIADRMKAGADAVETGAALTKTTSAPLMILAGSGAYAADLAFGAALRRYDYDAMKSGDKTEAKPIAVMSTKADDMEAAYGDHAAAAEGVFFTRDLTNAPANVLTTIAFADELEALRSIGLKVSVLEEADMDKLGMGSLLGVGQGSPSPSKIVIMEWMGGGDEKPFALVGKGVVFDTGGISLKPAGGMEDMTMDMGGAGVVSGVMKTLALRKAKANVVGLVGLVENMPDGLAQRPGDVVTSMKGDTIEVINTDAEGRLVLADVMWYAQEKFEPTGMINLATLTGAIIIGLGNENAGVFSNNDDLAHAFLAAAGAEKEGAWRMPLSPAYDKMLKSRIADMKNVGGRAAGSITAGQFLQRFVKPETPWIHLDIAGVASVKSETACAPKGATGWGVRALNRLIKDKYEG